MTIREAMIQAYMERGMSREDAELATRFSDTAFPEGASAAQSPVQPGQEREFIETMKQFFGKLDATPGAREALQAEFKKRTKQN